MATKAKVAPSQDDEGSKRRARVAIVNPPIESPVYQGDPKERVMASLAAEPKVTVYVPRALTFTADKHVEMHFNAGVQSMPQSVAQHWWMKAMGVEEYKGE